MSTTIAPDKVDFLTVACAHLRARESALVCQGMAVQIERLQADLARERASLEERRNAYNVEWQAIVKKYNLSSEAYCVLEGPDAGKIIDPSPLPPAPSSEDGSDEESEKSGEPSA